MLGGVRFLSFYVESSYSVNDPIADNRVLTYNSAVSAKSLRNFRSYAAMEALNIVLVPVTVLLLAPPSNWTEIFAMGLAIAACAGFLLVGAAYWAGLDHRLTRSNRSSLTRALALAHRLEIPLLLITGAALPMLAFAIYDGGWTWPLIGAAMLTLLAALEYVNYYHRQLQHFDRSSDFKRLINGSGFRRSHMARNLAAYRRRL